jgi:hypothetical protein
MSVGDDKIINEIIEAFGTFALGDIEYNVQRKPVAAFILCSCLIDQLATFRYNEPTEKNRVIYKRFIDDYMPHFRPLNLYVNLRCKLVHNYTVGKHIRLTNEEAPYENLGLGKNVNVLTAAMMYKELKRVFDEIAIELMDTASQVRKNAISRYKHEKSQIITKATYKFTTYSEGEADILIKHFTPIICTQWMRNGENIRIGSLSKRDLGEGRFLILVNTIHGKRGKTKSSTQIDPILAILGQESSTSVLNRLNPIQ